jgi:hypothetical protein
MHSDCASALSKDLINTQVAADQRPALEQVFFFSGMAPVIE